MQRKACANRPDDSSRFIILDSSLSPSILHVTLTLLIIERIVSVTPGQGILFPSLQHKVD